MTQNELDFIDALELLARRKALAGRENALSKAERTATLCVLGGGAVFVAGVLMPVSVGLVSFGFAAGGAATALASAGVRGYIGKQLKQVWNEAADVRTAYLRRTEDILRREQAEQEKAERPQREAAAQQSLKTSIQAALKAPIAPTAPMKLRRGAKGPAAP